MKVTDKFEHWCPMFSKYYGHFSYRLWDTVLGFGSSIQLEVKRFLTKQHFDWNASRMIVVEGRWPTATRTHYTGGGESETMILELEPS